MCVSLAVGLGIAGAVIGLTGGMLGMVGGIVGAEQQKAALDFEAEQAEANRKLYEQQALDIEEQGEWEKRNLALKQRSELASKQASAAASGVLLNTGSNLTMQEDAAQTNLLDMKQLDYDIKGRAYEARLGAWQSQNQYNSLSAQSKNTASMGALNAWTSGVSALGSTLSGAAAGVELGGRIDKWVSPVK